MTTSTLLTMSAATAAGVPSPGGAIFSSFIVPLILILPIFWLLIWRPQNQRVKQHQATIAAVKKGDDVITAGGIRGRVTKVSDDEAEVEIASGVRVKVVKSTLSQVLNAATKAAND